MSAQQIAMAHHQMLLRNPAGGSPVGVVQELYWGPLLPASGLTFSLLPANCIDPVTGLSAPKSAFTSGNRVVVSVVVFTDNGFDIPVDLTLSVNGAAATPYITCSNNTSSFHGSIFSAVSGGGSAGLSITFASDSYSGGGAWCEISAVECDDLTGVDTGSAAFATRSGSGGGSGTPVFVVSGALSNASERLFMLALTASNATTNLTLEAQDTAVYRDPDGSNQYPGVFAYRDNSGTGAQTATWTPDQSGDWGMMIVGFPR